MSQDFTRVEPDSPERCQGITRNGQCCFRRMEGIEFCPMHAGGRRVKLKTEARYKRLKEELAIRLGDHANDDQIKNIREEIGILRLVLETRLNACQDDVQLLVASQAIGDMVDKITKAVQACHKLEISLGQTMDKQQLATLFDKVLDILSKHIPDPATLEVIAYELTALAEEPYVRNM